MAEEQPNRNKLQRTDWAERHVEDFISLPLFVDIAKVSTESTESRLNQN